MIIMGPYSDLKEIVWKNNLALPKYDLVTFTFGIGVLRDCKLKRLYRVDGSWLRLGHGPNVYGERRRNWPFHR